MKITFIRKEKIKKSENKITEKKYISLLEDIVFYLIIIPLIIIAITIIWQRLVNPSKIPDIFGYKMFIVLEDDIDETIKYGDLVFADNIDPRNLEKNNLIAFRNNTNKVTIGRIIKITEDSIGKQFELQKSINEAPNTKYVIDEQIEGKINYKIPNIGLILFKIQEPYVILSLITIVILIGLGFDYVAEILHKN